MANEQTRAAEHAFRSALDEALAGLKGVGHAAAAKLIDEYAPRFARLSLLDPAEAAAEYDDLMVNLNAEKRLAGIDAETAAAGAVIRILKLAGTLARSLVLPPGFTLPPPVSGRGE